MEKNGIVLWENGREFFKRNKYALLAAFAFALVCYGFMLTHYTVGIDEEPWLMNTDPELIKNSWMMQGRFGIYFFNLIVTPMGNFIPFFWDFMGVMLWTLSGVVFAFCITMFYEKFSRFSIFVFCALFPSIPLAVGELLAFSMFSMQMGVAMLFVAFSILCIYTYFKCRRVLFAVLSAVFIFIATSFYQAFACAFLPALIMYVLVCILQEEKPAYSRILKNALWGVVVLAVGVGIYFLINSYLTTYVAPGGQSYFSEGFIGWEGSDGALSEFLTSVRSAGKILLGINTYGGNVILVLTVLFLIFAVISIVCKKGWKNKVMLLIICVLLLASPFFMALLLAQPNIIGRTLVALPLAMSLEAFLIVNLVRKTKVLRVIINLVFCVLLLANAAYMNEMYFHHYLAYEQDKSTGARIMERVSELGYNTANTPVLFVGKIDQPFVLEPHEAVTGSFFSWDGGNNSRMQRFLRTEGYVIHPYTVEQFEQGVEASEDMPCWPEKGSIRKAGDCLVIKLSDSNDAWYSLNSRMAQR